MSPRASSLTGETLSDSVEIPEMGLEHGSASRHAMAYQRAHLPPLFLMGKESLFKISLRTWSGKGAQC